MWKAAEQRAREKEEEPPTQWRWTPSGSSSRDRERPSNDAVESLPSECLERAPANFTALGKGTQKAISQELEAHRAAAMNAIFETQYALETPLRLAWTFSDSETSTRVFDTVPTHADLALKDKHFTITAQRYLGTPLAAFLAIEGQPHHGGRRDQPREVDRNGFNAGAVGNGPQTHRHHALRDAVCKLLLWAGATIAPESRNLFSRYFSQEATADTPKPQPLGQHATAGTP